jgi:hypothetical protein
MMTIDRTKDARAMRATHKSRFPWPMALGLMASLALTGTARAGKVSWLDDVVRSAVREAEVGAKVEARGLRPAGRLFAREAEESLEGLARRSDDLARSAR